MGCKASDKLCNQDEYPAHEVVVSSFAIDVRETTLGEYKQCVAAHAREEPGGGWDLDGDPQLPIANLDWFQADAYCKFRHKRLPTEAEWEKAAQSAAGGIYPWGNEPPSCSLAGLSLCNSGLVRVGSFPSGVSLYGALDMTGNAQEWISDWYAENSYAQSPRQDPTGPGDGQQSSDEKVVRGGSYYSPNVQDDGGYAGGRSSFRDHDPPENTYEDIGVRCVRAVR